MIIDVLKNLGLTEKEANIYLANLELGSSPVSDIARQSHVNRVTTYDILEKLIKKGYINYFTKNKIKYFTAVKPDTIYKITHQRTNDLKNVLPELKRLHGETPHPTIRYFEGINGIKAIYEDTLRSKTEILNYANSEEIREFWPDYDKEYVEKRAKKGIYLRGIAPLDEAGLKVKKENRKYNRNIRLIPRNKYNFSNEINIYDNKISIISFNEGLIGMIIKSTEIAETQRTIFKMVWEFAGQFRN
ncbi:TrmB family transcriptional regulator [Patescibacteria group bacterium]